MKLKPGSVPWLLMFDLRLMLRNVAGRMRVGYLRLLINVGVLWGVLMHLVAWGVVLGILAIQSHITTMQADLTLSVLLLLVFITVTGISMNSVISLVFLRGDLDMLCTSPLPVRNIFAARALTIGLQAMLLPAFLLLPVANVAALYGRFRWLAMYPCLMALTLLAAGLAILLTLALVRVIGPRRARVVTLIVGSLFGVSIFLALELPNMLGKTTKTHAEQMLMHWLHTARLAAPDSMLWYPARAMQGELWPLVVLLVVAAIFFFAVTFNLQRGFLLATQRAAGLDTQTRRTATKVSFNPHFWRVMFLKEWRLVYRNPQFLVQIFRTLVYLIPAAFFLFRDSTLIGGDHVTAVAALTVVLAAQLAGTLTWVSVCAEDAPEVLATAPRTSGNLRRTKLQVMLLPLWLALLPVVVLIGIVKLPVGIWLLIALVGATLSMGLYHLWMPVPGVRTQLRRAMRSSGGMQLERMLPVLAINFGWAAVAFCVPTGHWLGGMIALLAALAAPVFVWWRSRNAEPVLSY